MTFGNRLRNFAGELVGEAFVADIHNLDGRGQHEIDKLTALFEERILDFMLAEKTNGTFATPAVIKSPSRSET